METALDRAHSDVHIDRINSAFPQEYVTLAVQGRWQALLDRTSHSQGAVPGASGSHARAMTRTSFRVLAACKLRRLPQAADELCALGTLDELVGDAQASSATAGTGVPFAVRYLAAQLPALLGKPTAQMDALYRLLAFCTAQTEAGAAAFRVDADANSQGAATNGSHGAAADGLDRGDSGSGVGGGDGGGGASQPVDRPLGAGAASSSAGSLSGAAAVATPPADALLHQQLRRLWRRRRATVACSLAVCHLRNQNVEAALQLLDDLLAAEPGDPLLWEAVGRLQLQLGDVGPGQESFQHAERLSRGEAAAAAANGGGGAADAVAAGRSVQPMLDDGCLRLLSHDHAGALTSFEAALARHPSSAAAANGRAVALLYSGQLQEAVTSLEQGLLEHPGSCVAEEGLLGNLALMLDLAHPGASGEARARVAAYARRFAPDDFDASCIDGAV